MNSEEKTAVVVCRQSTESPSDIVIARGIVFGNLYPDVLQRIVNECSLASLFGKYEVEILPKKEYYVEYKHVFYLAEILKDKGFVVITTPTNFKQDNEVKLTIKWGHYRKKEGLQWT